MIIDNCGDKIEKGIPDSFSSMFDWVLTLRGLIKKTEIPRTIYVKTDYLPIFVQQILPGITNKFIFATGCSDYSPMINFKSEFLTLLNNDLLVSWYMVNCLERHPKIRAYPGGMCRNTDNDIKTLLTFNSSEKHTSNKILCCWRDRNFNVCGDDYITRHKTFNFIKQYPDLFDWVEPNLNTREFYDILSKYKFILCPVGNGVDPCPKTFEAILLKTVPIIIKTINTEDVYSNLPCIMVNNFSEILNINLDYSSFNFDCFDKLTCEYYYGKIVEELSFIA